MKKIYFLIAFSSLIFTVQNSNAQWVNNLNINTPICTSTNNQTEQQIISDGVGGSYIVWSDKRNANKSDIFVQRVNKNGYAMWMSDGLNICTDPATQSNPNVCSDGNNGIIVAWTDYRVGGNNSEVYAQRVDSNGTILWAYNGNIVSTNGVSKKLECIISDGSGGAIISWNQGNFNNTDILVQRLDGTGNPFWTASGIVVSTATAAKGSSALLLSADNKIFACWDDYRNGNSSDLFAQKFDMLGNRLWSDAAKGVVVYSSSQKYPKLALCDSGYGFYVGYIDSRPSGFNNDDLYAQKVDSAGNSKWVSGGVAIMADGYNQSELSLTSENVSYGFIASWTDSRNGASDIYAQRIDTGGHPIFPVAGLPIATNAGDQLSSVLFTDKLENTIIAWQNNNTTGSKIAAQKISKTGVSLWGTQAVLCTAAGTQSTPQIIPDGNGGVIATWENMNDTLNTNIFAQNINANGVLIPLAIQTINDLQIAVYPNPFQNNINIILPNTNNVLISLLDITEKK